MNMGLAPSTSQHIRTTLRTCKSSRRLCSIPATISRLLLCQRWSLFHQRLPGVHNARKYHWNILLPLQEQILSCHASTTTCEKLCRKTTWNIMKSRATWSLTWPQSNMQQVTFVCIDGGVARCTRQSLQCPIFCLDKEPATCCNFLNGASGMAGFSFFL